MIFRKQIAFLFGGIALISYLSLTYLPKQNGHDLAVMGEEEANSYLSVYMLDSDRLLVPLSFSIAPDLSLFDKVDTLFSYMSNVQPIKSFSPLFTKKPNLKQVELVDGILYVRFGKALSHYQKKNELKVLQALTWGCTQFEGVKQVAFYENENRCIKMPLDQTIIPNQCTRSIGINLFQSATDSLHDSEMSTIYGLKKIEGQSYLVPTSQRYSSPANTLEAKIDRIFLDLKPSSGLAAEIFNANLDYAVNQFQDGLLTLEIIGEMHVSDRSLNKNLYDTLVLSLLSIDKVERVKIQQNKKTIKLEDDYQEILDVSKMRYNQVLL